ncbi:MAG TPA: DUF4163 domain-containing protein [Sphingobacterium sp.]|nr:DUF4163 domain-containing protein [Sphingobacterium sp.]
MKYTALTIIVILLYSCGSNQQTQNEQEQKEQEQKPVLELSIAEHTDTLTYSYKGVKEISPYLSGKEDDLDTTYYQMTYPVFSKQHFNHLIRAAVFIEGEEDPNEAAQAFIDGYNEFVEDGATVHATASWVKDIKSQVFLNTPRVLSIRTQFYEYTGGAHGHTVALWSNYDIVEMREINLTDIVSEENLPELTRIAEKHFRTFENLADTASLSKDFFFIDGIFALNDNFGMTKNDLIFYYNEYEIKPYAKGSTVIQIPYTEIAEILGTRGQQYINSIRID